MTGIFTAHDPTHWLTDRSRIGEPSDLRCTRCGQTIEEIRATSVLCPKAPEGGFRGVYTDPGHPAHGVDIALYQYDAVYHHRIYATHVLMRHYRVPR